jgi:dihydropteroate synthase
VSVLDCASRALDLTSPRVMGILNVTPDSFSDGGDCISRDRALRRAEQMVDEGAAIIDVGGESTRPGASPVGIDDELRRVLPVIESITDRLPVPVSIDTSKPEVMRAAVAVGAGFINDVRALRVPGALAAAAELGVPVCLMHMQGQPGDMQQAPHYDDCVTEVLAFLRQRLQACAGGGIARSRLLVDPGFGFGKSLQHNLTLLARLDSVAALDVPVAVGLSRKSMLGAVTGRPVDERLGAGVAAAMLAVQRGARLVRTHDVAPTVDALRMAAAVAAASDPG